MQLTIEVPVFAVVKQLAFTCVKNGDINTKQLHLLNTVQSYVYQYLKKNNQSCPVLPPPNKMMQSTHNFY